MKVLKHVIIGLSLLSIVGCTNIVRENEDSFKIEKDCLNTSVVYTRDYCPKKDSLHVLRHFWGNSYYFEDYDCDGSVDMIYISKLKSFFYKKNPVTGEAVWYDKKLFDRADVLLDRYKKELRVDKVESSGKGYQFLDYID